MPLAEPMRLCPHGRSLLYVWRDGSLGCLCGVRADPGDQHLDDRLRWLQDYWDHLGRMKEVQRAADPGCLERPRVE